jgi:hypothetical protein
MVCYYLKFNGETIAVVKGADGLLYSEIIALATEQHPEKRSQIEQAEVITLP